MSVKGYPVKGSLPYVKGAGPSIPRAHREPRFDLGAALILVGIIAAVLWGAGVFR